PPPLCVALAPSIGLHGRREMAAALAPSAFGRHVPLVRSAGPEGARSPGTPDGVKVPGSSGPAADMPAEDRHAPPTTGVDVPDYTRVPATRPGAPLQRDD